MNPPVVDGKEIKSSKLKYKINDMPALPDQTDLIEYAYNKNGNVYRLVDRYNEGIIAQAERDGQGYPWNAQVHYYHPNYYYMGGDGNMKLISRGE